MSATFHVNGFDFTRLEDGFVLIEATAPAQRFSPKEWAAVVGRMSKRGQAGETAAREAEDDARALHTMEPEREPTARRSVERTLNRPRRA